MSAGGKGHSPRRFEVSHETFASNWDAIFGKSKNVFQQETQNPDRNPETASPAEIGCEVLGDRQSPAKCLPPPQTE